MTMMSESRLQNVYLYFFQSMKKYEYKTSGEIFPNNKTAVYYAQDAEFCGCLPSLNSIGSRQKNRALVRRVRQRLQPPSILNLKAYSVALSSHFWGVMKSFLKQNLNNYLQFKILHLSGVASISTESISTICNKRPLWRSYKCVYYI